MMKAPPRFSVAMATYNGERFLDEQLESIARQVVAPIELVACDDGSTDSTLAILRSFQHRAPFPVRLLENECNAGHAQTFLRAAMAATGDWVAFSDQDDVWLPQKLAHYARVIEAHPDVQLISHSAVQVDEHLVPLRARIPDHRRFRVRRHLQNRPLSVLPGFTCCVRRALLDAVRIDDRPEDMHRPGRKQSHDHFIYHLANTYGSVACLPEALVLYRRHAATVTGDTVTGAYDRSLHARLHRARYAQADGYRFMAEQASQYGEYYARLLGGGGRAPTDPEFAMRTRNAIAYYGAIAEAYRARAQIYDPRANLGTRLRSLLNLLSVGTYRQMRGRGAGLGHRAFVKDVAHVFVAWKP